MIKIQSIPAGIFALNIYKHLIIAKAAIHSVFCNYIKKLMAYQAGERSVLSYIQIKRLITPFFLNLFPFGSSPFLEYYK